MRYKRWLSLLLALALLLGCTGLTPVRAEQAPEETAQQSQQPPSEEIKAPKYVDSEQFSRRDHVQRLPDEERLDTYVFQNRDGTKSIYYMGQNVKYRDRSGLIREKDTTLVRGDRGYRMRENDVALHLPDSPADGISVGHGEHSVKLVPQGGSSSASLADNSITYTACFGPETALRYTPLLSGVKEDIILSSYTGQSSFVFIMETGGLFLYETDGQYYLAEDESAEAAFYLGQVVVFDAMGRPDEGSMTVEALLPGQRYRLTLSADVDFLTDPETVYPVTIDPSLTVGYTVQGVNAIIDAPVYEGKPNSNYYNYVYNRVGYYNDTYKTARTVMRPDAMLNSAEWQSLSEEDITGLSLFIRDGSGKAAKQVNVHALTENSSWTESSITWNNVGAYSELLYASATLGNSAWTEFDLTVLAQKWKDGTRNEDCGFLLKLADESVYRTFYACEYSTIDYRPYMVLDYQTDFSLNYNSKDIDEGGTFILVATAQLGIAGSVTWTSNNEDIATVNTNGVVTGHLAGTATITATCTDNSGNPLSASCDVYVTVSDGLYYLKNAASGLYLQDSDNLARILVKKTGQTERLPQLWKITYISYGNYSIRPIEDLSRALYVLSSGSVGTNDAAVSDSNIDSDAIWQIQHNQYGYAFKRGGLDSKTMTPISTSSNAYVTSKNWSASAICHWELEKAAGIFLRDTSTFDALDTTTVKYISYGESATRIELELMYEYYGTLDSDIAWSTSNSNIATVNSLGTVTAVENGQATISVSATLDGYSYTASVSIYVLVADGTYFLKNKATGLYANISSQTMVDGVTVNQWEFLGGDTQQWIFTHLGDGVYTIHAESGGEMYYLGVSDDSTAVDQPIVLRTGTITDGMKWKIEPTASNGYKLIPLTGISNDCVLATSTSNTTNGNILIQGTYVDNDSYRDEWILRPLIDYTLMFLGNEEYYESGDPYMPSILAAVNLELNNAGLEGHSFTTLNKDSALYQLSISTVFLCITHGSQNAIGVSGGGVYLTDINSLDEGALRNLRFVFLGACNTGQGEASSRNIVNALSEKGVDTVLGFTDRLVVAQANLWSETFSLRLASGMTIAEAINAADGELEKHPELKVGNIYFTSEKYRYVVGPTDYNPWD